MFSQQKILLLGYSRSTPVLQKSTTGPSFTFNRKEVDENGEE